LHSSLPGAVILDPFCGSGLTLVAAQDLDRRFIGIDLDPVHCRTARGRLRASALTDTANAPKSHRSMIVLPAHSAT
jgi:DNA modification methylase